ncbi:MAG: M15 family metallopeptidase [Clostridia bacterium]|nr:M15 family metallopeptidase [Clostridia bacterium]
MNKTAKSKKQLKAKMLLSALLAGIMLVLIAGYFLTKGKKKPPEAPVSKNTAEEITQESTTYFGEIVTSSDSYNVERPNPDELSENTTNAKTFAKILEPTDSKEWFLAIVSVDYPLPESYKPSLAPALSNSQVKLDSRIVQKYKRMYDGAKLSDCNLNPYAGYRDNATQDSAYKRKVNSYINQGYSAEQAEALAKRKIAPAGCSESNSGLAVDIVSASNDFENTKEFQWLQDNAYKYGFVLRYPKDKEDITGVDYQPWHWRYVGEYAAGKMHEQNLCLEEYLGIV